VFVEAWVDADRLFHTAESEDDIFCLSRDDSVMNTKLQQSIIMSDSTQKCRQITFPDAAIASPCFEAFL